jgi:hypothetical protein
VFWSLPALYAIALSYALYLYRIPWVWASLLIGLIYIGSSILAFHQTYFDAYIKTGENASHLKLLTQVVLWAILNLAIQLFVLLGFLMTVGGPQLKQNIYIHPSYYGQIYKHTNSVLSQMDLLFDAELADDTAELEAYFGRRDSFVERFCSPHLKSSRNDETITRDAKQTEEEIYKIPFLIAIAFGFLGALIYTLSDTGERIISRTLRPSNSVSYLIRFIVAPTLCIVFAYYIMADWWTNFAPLAFFCIGYFPDEAVKLVRDKFLQKG